MLMVFPSGLDDLDGCHIPGAEQSWVPRLNWSAAEPRELQRVCQQQSPTWMWRCFRGSVPDYKDLRESLAGQLS